MSKKVLMVAHQFPPIGGPGVQRSAKFAKYLQTLGYEPIVLTIDDSVGVTDFTLIKEVATVKCYKTKAYNMKRWPKFLGLLSKIIKRKLLIPDAEWIWYRKTRKIALDICKKEHIDIIYTTSYPYSDHLIGLYVKKHLPHLPWVVDFRDEWTNNPYILDMNYTKFRIKREKFLEKQVAYGCDGFVTNTPLMLEGFLNDYDIKEKSIVIPNGYDSDDFEDLSIRIHEEDILTITYAGAMYGRRKPDQFLKAVKHLIDTAVIDKDCFRIRVVGDYNQQAIDQAYEWLGYKEILSFYEYMPHKESISFLMSSDVLLLIIGNGPGARNFYTGKIFEYIYTGKPILAIVPEDGCAADVIRETKTGYVADGTNQQAIVEAVENIYNMWKDDKLTLNPDEQEISKYHRLAETKQLVEMFNRLIQS